MEINSKIIAHRGIFDNIKIPENSIKAFQKAIDKNIPIELDVQLTKDNVLVVFHDYTLDRMTSQKGILQKKTYEEIASEVGYKTHSAVLKRIKKIGEEYQKFSGDDLGF